MIRLSALALAAGLAVSCASLAHAGAAVTGKWTYKVGTTGTPCVLTFTAGNSETSGDVTSAADCNDGLYAVGHWSTLGSSLRLTSPSGTIVAVLHAKGDDYVGKPFGGSRKILLTR